MNSKYKNIVFDMGMVLVDYNPEAVIRKYTDDEGLIRIVRLMLFDSPEWILLDAGLMSEELALEKILRKAENEEEKDLIRKCFSEWFDYNLETRKWMIDIIKKIKDRGQNIYILSNAHKRFAKRYREVMPMYELYDGTFFSADYGLLKPQKEIYERFLEVFNLDAETCFFIDDTYDNIKAAKEIGIDGYNFVDAKEESIKTVLGL